MSIAKLLSDACALWLVRRPPAEESAISSLAATAPFPLPADYLELLRHVNGGEGELAVDPGWFQLWSAEEVLDNNRGYEVSHWHPGYFGFGSSGGGVMFAFRPLETPRDKVFGIPFDSIDPADISVVSANFVAFVMALGRTTREGVAEQDAIPDRGGM